MIATQNNGQGVRLQYVPDGQLHAAIVVTRFGQVGQHIAAVDEADVVAALQQRPVDIEVVMIGMAHDTVAKVAYGLWRIRLVVGKRAGAIRRSERRSEEHTSEIQSLMRIP